MRNEIIIRLYGVHTAQTGCISEFFLNLKNFLNFPVIMFDMIKLNLEILQNTDLLGSCKRCEKFSNLFMSERNEGIFQYHCIFATFLNTKTAR